MASRRIIFDWLISAFDACEAHLVDVSVLQPADPFLDTAGESLRRRIFMTENENGDSLCLRPEFTIPICLKHIENNVLDAARYSYLGEVFRQDPQGYSTFYQAGIEDIGDHNQEKSDARSLFDALTLLDEIKAPFTREILLGDKAVFRAVLEALGLPSIWRLRLLQSFGDNTQLRTLMQNLSTTSQEKKIPQVLQKNIEKCDEESLIRTLEEEMLAANISPKAGRTPKEIAYRLIEQYELGRILLDQKIYTVLEAFLDIDVSLNNAEKTLNEFANENQLNLENIIAQFSARNRALQMLGIDLLSIRYNASFGRSLDYYTGLVFEIKDGQKIIVGGGRYDRLLTMLGSKEKIPAVGFSIWLDSIGGGKR